MYLQSSDRICPHDIKHKRHCMNRLSVNEYFIFMNCIASVYLCDQYQHCSARPQEGHLEVLSSWNLGSVLQRLSSEVHAHGSPTWPKHFLGPQSLAS